MGIDRPLLGVTVDDRSWPIAALTAHYTKPRLEQPAYD